MIKGGNFAMSHRFALILLLFSVAAAVSADDFVQTFNKYYEGRAELYDQQGEWNLRLPADGRYESGMVKFLDIQNYYVQFTLYLRQDPKGPADSPSESYTFATYPRVGTSDLVAEEGPDDFGFYAIESGKWRNVTTDVLPKGVFQKFFAKDTFTQLQGDFPADQYGRVNGRADAGSDPVLMYMLDIPVIGTKTTLRLVQSSVPPETDRLAFLVASAVFHRIELSWNKKQGLFTVTRFY